MQATPRTTALMIPGRYNSGPEHWQTRWEIADSDFVRVQQREWNNPSCEDWCQNLEQAVRRLGSRQTVLVAHSLGCLLVGHWALRSSRRVKAALLVAPSNPERADFAPGARGFAPIPRVMLPFPSIVVASSNDSRGSLEHAAACARAWGSRFVNAGPLGHINADSGLGDWPEGYALYKELVHDGPADPQAALLHRGVEFQGSARAR